MRNLDRIKVHYQKLGVSEAKKAKHEIQLAKINELAPFGSRISAHFMPVLGQVRGQLKVTNCRHSFLSLTLAPDVDSAMNDLVRDMDQQILQWKRGRFNGSHGAIPAAATA